MPGQARPGQARPGQARPGQARPGAAKAPDVHGGVAPSAVHGLVVPLEHAVELQLHAIIVACVEFEVQLKLSLK